VTTSHTHARPAAVRFIFFTILLDFIGIGLIIPVAPKLVEQLTGLDDTHAAPIYAWLAVTYAFFQFLFAPILGSLSDRFGRRPVILVSLFGSAIDYFAAAVAPNILVLFITRALNGISGANVSACNAYIADVTPPEKRAAGFGMLGAAIGLGFIIGPALGGVLGKFGLHWPFIAAGVLTLINWFYGLLVLPESLDPHNRRSFSMRSLNPFGAITNLWSYPFVLALAFGLFFINAAQFALHATWVLSMSHRFGWNALQTGLSLTVVGIGAAFVQGFLARSLIPKLGEVRALVIGMIIGVIAYFGYGLATQGWMIYAIVAIASLGGIGAPALQSIITKYVQPNEQGKVQGGLQGLTSIATVLGMLGGGYVFQYFTERDSDHYLPGASFYASGLSALVGLLICLFALKSFSPTRPTQSSPTRSSLN
jgi:MFS transporter, DHA1 family, tetracycline resistance protein